MSKNLYVMTVHTVKVRAATADTRASEFARKNDFIVEEIPKRIGVPELHLHGFLSSRRSTNESGPVWFLRRKHPSQDHGLHMQRINSTVA